MGNQMSWAEWQKLCIREDYKDIKPVTPARDKAQLQFDLTAKKSLARVKRHAN